mmetsp:Transcript_65447/g.174384  ORF Transcript_65447/g.174384 Transcript_65447/m.174384 type:complete len:218 (-) Transcript_65447:189-842(-)
MAECERFPADGVAAADAAGGSQRLAEAWQGGKDYQQLRKRSASASMRARAASRGARRSLSQVSQEAPQEASCGEPQPDAAAPDECAPAEADGEAPEERLMELACVAEELTDALERSREADEALQQELAEVRRLLQQERAQRVGRELALAGGRRMLAEALQAKEAQAAEVEGLRAQLAAGEREVGELRMTLQVQELESGIEQALAAKGQGFQFRHLVV